MLCQFFGSAHYERSLRRRRLAGAGLLVLGALGCLCYVLLLREGGPLSDHARSFYLGFSCGLALAGAVLLVRAQWLLSHPQEQKRARVREQDEREQSIVITLPPMSAVIYKCTRKFPARRKKEGKLAVKAPAAKPAVRKASAKPAVKEKAAKPALRKTAAKPAVKEKAAHPAVRPKAQHPAVKKSPKEG